MNWNPYYSASDDTFDEFMSSYHAEYLADYEASTHDSVLCGSLRNRNPTDRVLIANFLLDRGADATYTAGPDNDRINVLHAFFGVRVKYRNFELEAPLLQRLLESGADINHRSPRFGFPLETLKSTPAPDDQLAPFYDVVFARPDIDMDVVINMHGSTMRDLLVNSGRPDLPRRAREYIEAHPQ